jgi:hypothetical protein
MKTTLFIVAMLLSGCATSDPAQTQRDLQTMRFILEVLPK